MSSDTDLTHRIEETPLCDTHEHLYRHQSFTPERLDILGALFENYVTADLVVAGAAPDAVQNLIQPDSGPVADRFRLVETAWQRCQHTGYGEAVRLIAQRFYGLTELTPDSLAEAQDRHAHLMATRTRQQILQQDARLDHVQIDDFTMDITPDTEDPDFFLYDISLHNLVSGTPDLDALQRLTGVEVRDLPALQTAIEAVFAIHAGEAVACKTQHAYDRTLAWRRRDRADAATVFARYREAPSLMSTADRLLLGDWCPGPVCFSGPSAWPAHQDSYRILCRHSRMPLEFISCRHLCGLLAAHLSTDFVLMHNSYPYAEELVALAKHYPMCISTCVGPGASIRLMPPASCAARFMRYQSTSCLSSEPTPHGHSQPMPMPCRRASG